MADVTLLGVHHEELRTLLADGEGREASAYVLFGEAAIASDPWTGGPRRRLTSHAVVPIPEEDRISASSTHVTWNTRSFVRLLKDAEGRGLVPGIAHTHPAGIAAFSGQDDRNEADLAAIVANRSGAGGFVSLLLGGDGTVAARTWTVPGTCEDCARVLVSGRRIAVYDRGGSDGGDEHLDRQARLFGPGFNPAIRKLRVGVVGAGGTGSPTAMLLARLGVGGIVAIDDDVVETTNLNRVHGSRRSDAEKGTAKVDVLAREIGNADLGVDFKALRCWAGDRLARDALRSCDVVFGCTDDHDGRAFLNRLAHFYGITVIDMGLRVMAAREDRPYEMSARITVVTPGSPCLLCRGVIDPRRAAEEALRRRDPAEYERLKAEAYVLGGGDPAPAIVTFTTEAAAMAVNELLQGLTGYRGAEGMKSERRRRFDTLEDRSTTCSPRPYCEICASRSTWGRGDVVPFLHRAG